MLVNPGTTSADDLTATRHVSVGLDHLDLYLIHQPFGDVYRFWRALQQLNAEGLARAIGVLLRWLIQRDVVVIPESVRRDRMAANFDIFDFTLTEDGMTAITALDTGVSLFFDHRTAQIAANLNRMRES